MVNEEYKEVVPEIYNESSSTILPSTALDAGSALASGLTTVASALIPEATSTTK
jgi:hypothetical protein